MRLFRIHPYDAHLMSLCLTIAITGSTNNGVYPFSGRSGPGTVTASLLETVMQNAAERRERLLSNVCLFRASEENVWTRRDPRTSTN